LNNVCRKLSRRTKRQSRSPIQQRVCDDHHSNLRALEDKIVDYELSDLKHEIARQNNEKKDLFLSRLKHRSEFVFLIINTNRRESLGKRFGAKLKRLIKSSMKSARNAKLGN